MKPINIGGHSAYQERVLTQLRKYYPNATTSLSPSSWQILDKFWNLDLHQLMILYKTAILSLALNHGFLPTCFALSLCLLNLKLTFYTRFAADLKENYLHAIISGFSVGDTPGVGTFYDFHRRLWLSPDKNLSNPVHPPKEKPQEPKGKEEKAPPVEKLTVDDLFRQFEKNPPDDMAPSSKLWEIFNTFFLQHSAKLRLNFFKIPCLSWLTVLLFILLHSFFADDRHRIEPI